MGGWVRGIYQEGGGGKGMGWDERDTFFLEIYACMCKQVGLDGSHVQPTLLEYRRHPPPRGTQRALKLYGFRDTDMTNRVHK